MASDINKQEDDTWQETAGLVLNGRRLSAPNRRGNDTTDLEELMRAIDDEEAVDKKSYNRV